MRTVFAKPGMVLARDVLDDRGSLLLEKGISLTESYITHLKQLGIDNIHIKHPVLEEAKPIPLISDSLRLELAFCFQTLFTIKSDHILSTKLQMRCLRQLNQASDSVVSQIEFNMPNILNTEIRKPTTDEISHAVNVCLLSVVTGHYLSLSRQVLRELALGALLHDLGKSLISLVDEKPVNSLNLHPMYTRDLLLKCKFSTTVARIAAEHHEYYNGSGFPLGLCGKATHPLSRIVSLANYFDNAMTASRKGQSLQETVESLLASSDVLFDHNTLRAFLYTIPIYTIGSMVRLSTGQTGYVIQNRANHPLRPIVRIFKKNTYDDIDLAHQPNVAITDIIEDPQAS